MLAFFKKQHEDCVLRKSEDIPFLSNSPYFTLQEKRRGKNHIALQDEELDLVMKLVETTSKSGQWRSTCDFFLKWGVCSGVGMVYISRKSVYRIDSIFLWALIELCLLSVSSHC